jgi:methylamine dehydrogenase accessory protein MauD
MSDPLLASYILLWVLVVATLVVTLGTTRQVALLTRRFPFNQIRDESGPKVGAVVPAIEATTLAGDTLTLAREATRRSAFVFVEDGCTTCDKIRDPLEQTAREATDTDFWLVFEREPNPDSDFRRFDGRLVVAPEAFERWEIHKVPFACVVAEDGKLAAKGELQAVARLREELGLPPLEPVSEPETDEEGAHDEPARQPA